MACAGATSREPRVRRRKRLRKKLYLLELEKMGNFDRFPWVITFAKYGYRGWQKRLREYDPEWADSIGI